MYNTNSCIILQEIILYFSELSISQRLPNNVCLPSGAWLRTATLLNLVNRLALKSGIDGHQESPQVSHSRPANTAQRLNSVYMVVSSD